MYKLNIDKSSIVPTTVIIGRVQDNPVDSLEFQIYNGLDPMNLTGYSLEFKGTTPNNKKVYSKAISVTNASKGYIRFTIPTNMYASRGQFKNAYFTLTRGSHVESTNDIIVNVLNAVDYTLEDADEIRDILDEILKESQATIDKHIADMNKSMNDALNANKSSLDKSLKDADDRINTSIKNNQTYLDNHMKQYEQKINTDMAKMQASVTHVNSNMDTLKKDVDSFKSTMDADLARMKKQLDDLQKVINSTDVQRPPITDPSGLVRHTISDRSKTTREIFDELGHGRYSVYLHATKDSPENYILGTFQSSNRADEGMFSGVGLVTGNAYSYAFASSGIKGWRRLDGQVQRITNDNGTSAVVVNGGQDVLTRLSESNIGLRTIIIQPNAIGSPDSSKRYVGTIFTHSMQDGLAYTSMIDVVDDYGNNATARIEFGKFTGWKVSGGEIGNVNLMMNADNIKLVPSGSSKFETTSNVTVSEWNTNSAFTIKGTKANSNIFGILPSGRKSIDVRTRVNQTYVHSLYIRNNHPKNPIYVSNNLGGTYEVKSGEIERVFIIGKGNGTQFLQINLQVAQNATEFDFTYYRPMISEGDTLSAWSKSPEDYLLTNDLDPIVIAQTSNSTFQTVNSYSTGTYPLYLHATKDSPEKFILGTLIVTTTLRVFIGVGALTGNTYSYNSLGDTDRGWKRLDNDGVIIPEIPEIPTNKLYTYDDARLSVKDMVAPLGDGIHNIQVKNSSLQQEQNIIGNVIISEGGRRIRFQGTSMNSGNDYVYWYSEGVNSGGWRRLS